MSGTIRVYVNELPVEVAPGASASAAVLALNPDLATKLGAGLAYLTDGRGIQCSPDTPLSPGAILRVIVSARMARDPDA